MQETLGSLKTRASAALTLGLALVAASTLMGCGSGNSQAAARDSVTKASCDWQQMCGNIGAGKTYSSRDNCMVQLRATWDNVWPAEACDGKINQAQLDLCLDAIPLVKCDDALGLFVSLAANCGQAKVCAGS